MLVPALLFFLNVLCIDMKADLMVNLRPSGIQEDMFRYRGAKLPSYHPLKNSISMQFKEDEFNSAADASLQRKMLYNRLAAVKPSDDEPCFALAVLSEASILLLHLIHENQAIEILKLKPATFFYAIFLVGSDSSLKVWKEMNGFLFENIGRLSADVALGLAKFFFSDSANLKEHNIRLPPGVVSGLLSEGKFILVTDYLISLYNKGFVLDALKICAKSGYYQKKYCTKVPIGGYDSRSQKIIQCLASTARAKKIDPNTYDELFADPLTPKKCKIIVSSKLPAQIFGLFTSVENLYGCISILTDYSSNYSLFEFVECFNSPKWKSPECTGGKTASAANSESEEAEKFYTDAFCDMLTGLRQPFAKSSGLSFEEDSEIHTRFSDFYERLNLNENDRDRFIDSYVNFSRIYLACRWYLETGYKTFHRELFPDEVSLDMLRCICQTLELEFQTPELECQTPESKKQRKKFIKMMTAFAIEASLVSGLDIRLENFEKLQDTVLTQDTVFNVFGSMDQIEKQLDSEHSRTYFSRGPTELFLVNVGEKVQNKCPMCKEYVFSNILHLANPTAASPSMYHPSCFWEYKTSNTQQ